MKHLSIDVETFSTIDIKAGAYKYAEGMELLLLAYSYDYGPVKCIDLARGEKIPAQLEADIFSPDVIKHAFNANFERVILGKHFGRYCEPEQWRCTLVRSAMGGYPLSLDQSAKALGLSVEKDAKGKALIKYFSMPCKPTKSNGQRTRNYPEHDLEKWSEFVEYCKQDVVVEQEVEKALYWVQISEQEHQNWVLNQKMNDRGWKVDLELARNAVKLDTAFREKLTRESKAISGLSNPNSVEQLKEWLSDAGVEVDSLNKDVLPGLIEEVFDEDVERMLQIRQEMSKTSVKKYSVMINSAGQDGRVRGLFQFYGANRTGREASRLVQVQNLPRNKYKGASLDAARELVLNGEGDILDMCYGPTPDALSQLIRTAFIADKGKELAVTDFTAIEAVLVSYLAGEEWRLDVFKSHGKIYEASASKMFNIPIEQITKGSDLRQKGKVTELACSYGGGKGALIRMGALEGGIEEKELILLVRDWRKANSKIVKLWYDMADAAKHTIRTGEKTSVGDKGVGFHIVHGNLAMRLPSGRCLYYINPTLEVKQKIVEKETPVYNEKGEHTHNKIEKKLINSETICFWGVDQTTRTWCKQYTHAAKLVENLVQGFARDCLFNGLQNLHKENIPVVASIHDEVVAEVPKGKYSIDEINSVFCKPADWMAGIPLKADGFLTDYYQKD